MDVYLSWIDIIKLGLKLATHRVLQKRLATNETFNVTTTYGPIKGLKRNNVYAEAGSYVAFEGIPYAKPPLGELRFRSPQKPEAWSDVLDCTSGRNKPVQHQMFVGFAEGSEDCLYLNVYARNLTTCKPLPVMVWIYGGAFTVGEASRDLYAPDYFMTKDVILVTFNYRVGPLGFMSFNDPDLNIPGNAGLKDQVMALQWIKENIRNFNGDTNNITVFGESAGAGSVHILMLTEPAKGLFHKAIIQSGSALCPWANSYLSDGNYRLANYLGYRGDNTDKALYNFFKSLNAKKFGIQPSKLFNQQERLEQYIVGYGVVIEPYDTTDALLRKPIKELLSTAWGNDIPILIGGTSFEGLLYYTTTVRYPQILKQLPDNHYIPCLMSDIRNSHTQSELLEMGNKLENSYFGDTESENEEEENENVVPKSENTLFKYLNLISHNSFWHGIHRTILARCKYASTAKTFCYRFDMDSPHFNHFRMIKCGRSCMMKGASHGDDISYLFYHVLAHKLPQDTDEYKTIQNMIKIWYNFALNSDPNYYDSNGIKWESIQNVDVNTDIPYKCMNITNNLAFIELPEYPKLKLWDSFYKINDLI